MRTTELPASPALRLVAREQPPNHQVRGQSLPETTPSAGTVPAASHVAVQQKAASPGLLGRMNSGQRSARTIDLPSGISIAAMRSAMLSLSTTDRLPTSPRHGQLTRESQLL